MELAPQTATIGWLGGLQKITNALSASGITLEEWKSAFGAELGLLGNWPANTQWPSLFIALPVKDPAKANSIVAKMTTGNPEGDEWTHQEKGGCPLFFQCLEGAVIFLFTDNRIIGPDAGGRSGPRLGRGSDEKERDRGFRAGRDPKFPDGGALGADGAPGVCLTSTRRLFIRASMRRCGLC